MVIPWPRGILLDSPLLLSQLEDRTRIREASLPDRHRNLDSYRPAALETGDINRRKAEPSQGKSGGRPLQEANALANRKADARPRLSERMGQSRTPLFGRGQRLLHLFGAGLGGLEMVAHPFALFGRKSGKQSQHAAHRGRDIVHQIHYANSFAG